MTNNKYFRKKLYNNEEYDELCVFLINIINKIELLKNLGKHYIEMKVNDLRFILDKTSELKIDKSMIYIFNRSNKKK